METTVISPIAKAVSRAGGAKALADQCGVSVQAVHKWMKAGRPPAERCLDIERCCARKITRYELRPDVFGAPPQASSGAAEIEPCAGDLRRPPVIAGGDYGITGPRSDAPDSRSGCDQRSGDERRHSTGRRDGDGLDNSEEV